MNYYRTANRQHQAAKLLNQHWQKTKENLLGDGLKLCRRYKAHNSEKQDTACIEVSSKDGKTVTRMVDVAHCGNAHLCAHCSRVKSAHMRNWISLIFLPMIEARGLSTGLLTLTARHRYDSDWTEFVNNFYLALRDFGNKTKYRFNKLGCVGRIRAMESPVGSNGLHLHIHDLFTYTPGALDSDKALADFTAMLLKKWKASLKKFGLNCNDNGVHIKSKGTFEAEYVAKDEANNISEGANIASEMAAHDTKTKSKRDLKTLFQLLDNCRFGDTKAGGEWIRAAHAIQGRDRWNVGQLAKKLDIPCPSDWRPTLDEDKEKPSVEIIEYPQSHHMVATAPSSNRAGLAFLLRAAKHAIFPRRHVKQMALRLCEETKAANVELIKQKYARQYAARCTEAGAEEEMNRYLISLTERCNLKISDYIKRFEKTKDANVELIKQKYARQYAARCTEASTEEEMNRYLISQTERCNLEISDYIELFEKTKAANVELIKLKYLKYARKYVARYNEERTEEGMNRYLISQTERCNLEISDYIERLDAYLNQTPISIAPAPSPLAPPLISGLDLDFT